LILKNSTIIVL